MKQTFRLLSFSLALIFLLLLSFSSVSAQRKEKFRNLFDAKFTYGGVLNSKDDEAETTNGIELSYSYQLNKAPLDHNVFFVASIGYEAYAKDASYVHGTLTKFSLSTLSPMIGLAGQIGDIANGGYITGKVGYFFNHRITKASDAIYDDYYQAVHTKDLGIAFSYEGRFTIVNKFQIGFGLSLADTFTSDGPMVMGKIGLGCSYYF